MQVGSFFGELEFLGVSESRSMTLKAVVYCETATLLPEDISHVFVRHPFLRSRFERYANMQQEVDRMVEEGADMDEIAAKLKESTPGLEHSASGWSRTAPVDAMLSPQVGARGSGHQRRQYSWSQPFGDGRGHAPGGADNDGGGVAAAAGV